MLFASPGFPLHQKQTMIGQENFALINEDVIKVPGVFGSAEPLFLLLFAFGLEALYGGILRLEGWLPRPRKMMGLVVVRLDRALNRSRNSTGQKKQPGQGTATQLVNGATSLFLLAGLACAAGYGLSFISRNAPFLWLIEVGLIALCLDNRSHQVRLNRVRKALALNSLITVRGELYPLVSSWFRITDLERLQGSGLAATAVGGMARGFVEGFVAPAFWYGLLGLPGLFVQQAVYQGARFYRQRQLQAPLERNFGRSFTGMDHVLMALPDALTALLFILAALFVPGAAIGQAIRRCWSSQRLADAALGGALNFQPDQPGQEKAEKGHRRKDLERASLIVIISGILAVGLIAAVVLLRYAL